MVETIIYNNVYVWSIFMFLTSVIYIGFANLLAGAIVYASHKQV